MMSFWGGCVLAHLTQKGGRPSNAVKRVVLSLGGRGERGQLLRGLGYNHRFLWFAEIISNKIISYNTLGFTQFRNFMASYGRKRDTFCLDTVDYYDTFGDWTQRYRIFSRNKFVAHSLTRFERFFFHEKNTSFFFQEKFENPSLEKKSIQLFKKR